MAYAPIALTIPQYENYANNWLKAYEQGTTTPMNIATDAAAGTLLAKCELDTQGFPITAGSARFIPFIDGYYDLWLFPTEAEADANDTTNAIQFADNLNASTNSSFWYATKALVSALTLTSADAGRKIFITSQDGGEFTVKYNATPSTYADDGGTFCGTQFIPDGGDGTIGIVRDYSSSVSVTWFGAYGGGTIDDTTSIRNTMVKGQGGIVIFPKTSDYYLITDGIAVYEGTDIEGMGSTIIVKAAQNQYNLSGFHFGSNTSINNIKGYLTTNGFTITSTGQLLVVGLFYGVTSVARASSYSNFIPGISTDNSPVTDWDAPTNVIITNIESDISALPTTNKYGASLVYLTNFISNIVVENIVIKGFASYVNVATSMITTGNGVLNTNNYFRGISFEWGNSTAAFTDVASGVNIRVNNIWGSGLQLHNHSGIVSLGNAHSFHVSNIYGEDTGQIFHCSSSSLSVDLSDSVEQVNATNRIAENLVGVRLYTWYADGHYNAGVNIGGFYEKDSALKPINSTEIRNVNIAGIFDTTAVPPWPDNGVIVGDATWSDLETRHVTFTNMHISNFDIGVLVNNAKNITFDNLNATWNRKSGLSVAGSTPYVCQNITIRNSYFKQNNLGAFTTYTTNEGVGATVFDADNVIFRDCIFGDYDVAATSETQLHSVFLRNGTVGFVKFDSCVFQNYKHATSSYDIYSNSSSLQPVVRDCRSVMTADWMPRMNQTRPGFDAKVVASVEFTAAPSTVTMVRETNIASAAYSALGRFIFTFQFPLPNANYYVLCSGGGATSNTIHPLNNQTSNSTTTFEIYVKNPSGSALDPVLPVRAVVMYIEAPDDLGQAVR